MIHYSLLLNSHIFSDRDIGFKENNILDKYSISLSKGIFQNQVNIGN